MRKKALIILAYAWLPQLAGAEALRGENLIQTLPAGFKVDFGERKGNFQIVELVPRDESVHDWTQMVTTNIYYGGLPVSPSEYRSRFQQMWQRTCPEPGGTELDQGSDNGYPVALWLMTCARLPATGKPEITLVKAIKGNDSFYVIQRAWRHHPDDGEMAAARQYLDRVHVCDTRLPDRPCPTGED